MMKALLDWKGGTKAVTPPTMQRFHPGLLPASCLPYIKDIAQRMGVPIDATIPALFGALGVAIGNQKVICPKRHDDTFEVRTNLWGLLVCVPSTLKSPVKNNVLFPLTEFQKECDEHFDLESRKWRAEEEMLKIELQDKKDKLKKLFHGESEKLNKEDIEKRIKEILDKIELERPKQRRVLVHDPTIEALQLILKDNPRGVFYANDEFSRLLSSFERSGRESDRAFLLETWGGDGSYTVDRVSRRCERIDSMCVSLWGNIQPDVFKCYIDSSKVKIGNDGFFNRLQILVSPSIEDYYLGVDRAEDLLAKKLYLEQFRKLLLSQGKDKVIYKFNTVAQEKYDTWTVMHQQRMQNASTVMQAHLGKYRSLIPALALIYHLTDGSSEECVSQNIDVGSILKAISFGDYLKSHAEHIFDYEFSLDLIAANKLIERIYSGDLFEGITLRNLKRKKWSGLTDDTAISGGLDILEENNWVKQVELPKVGNKVSTIIHLNPAINIDVV